MAAWNTAVESVLPVGSAPAPTTLIEGSSGPALVAAIAGEFTRAGAASAAPATPSAPPRMRLRRLTLGMDILFIVVASFPPEPSFALLFSAVPTAQPPCLRHSGRC